MILQNLPLKINIVAEHKADLKYPIVSSASIIAKVVRDQEIEKLKNDYGNFGSGYPADPKTIHFLKKYYQINKDFPPIVRHSWKTLQKIKDHFSQSKLKI